LSAALPLIRPQWPAPPQVGAAVTTRDGGVSRGVYASLNLADHVGDDPAYVAANRRHLRAALGLRDEPAWLRQVHGCRVARLPTAPTPEADAAWTDQPGLACAVLSADCLPVLFCDEAGSCVAAAHAGWRGLAGGVLEATIAALPVPARNLLAWFGPAIGPEAFEVGEDVRQAFVDHDARDRAFFRSRQGQRSPGKYLADLEGLARRRLQRAGVVRIFGGGSCTHSNPENFYSHRRDGVSGRIASLIWLRPDP
jgi:hypothetical protein